MQKKSHANLISCIACFSSVFFLIMVYYMKKSVEIDKVKWDVETVTAADYTVEMKLNKKFQPYQDFEIVVCNEGNVYLDKIEKHIFNKNSPKSVFVTIPVRLGLASIAQEYLESVKEVFNFSSNVGMCGGKEHSALFFVGFSNPDLIYLDPHYV